jgi:hypothetical protein
MRYFTLILRRQSVISHASTYGSSQEDLRAIVSAASKNFIDISNNDLTPLDRGSKAERQRTYKRLLDDLDLQAGAISCASQLPRASAQNEPLVELLQCPITRDDTAEVSRVALSPACACAC